MLIQVASERLGIGDDIKGEICICGSGKGGIPGTGNGRQKA